MFSSASLTSTQRNRLPAEVLAGTLIRVRRGYYEHTSKWTQLYNYDKHRLRAIALGDKLTAGALTGASAATVLGLPIRITAATPLVMVGKSKAHSQADGLQRVVWSRGEQSRVTQVHAEGFTVPVTSLPFCLAELARSLSVEEAVVAMDHCLHNKLVTPAELTEMANVYKRKPHAGRVTLAADLAEGLTESPMETRLRLAMLRAGLSDFLIQPEIVLFGINRFIRPDFFFPDNQLIVEYDGQAKYDSRATAAFDDMNRMHAAANCGITFLRVNKESFSSGAWLRDLQRLLSRPAVTPHPDVGILGGQLCSNRWVVG